MTRVTHTSAHVLPDCQISCAPCCFACFGSAIRSVSCREGKLGDRPHKEHTHKALEKVPSTDQITMSSRSDAVQRRGRSGQPTGQTAVPGLQRSSSIAAGGLKTWHLWMLFGLGWPSILLFGLSTISAFGAKAQGLLLTFGWLFVGCWLANTAAGILTDKHTKKQTTVFHASYITAGIGCMVGGVLTASYAIHNWPWLYIFGFAAVAGAAWFVRSLDDGTANQTALPAGEGAAAGAPAAGAGTAEVGDLIDLRDD